MKIINTRRCLLEALVLLIFMSVLALLIWTLKDTCFGTSCLMTTKIIEHRQNGKRSTQTPLFGDRANTSDFLQYLPLEDAQLLFHRYMSHREILCDVMVRVGDVNEGGYEICIMPPFHLMAKKCLVYSFGIGDNWSFDDGLMGTYGCEVHSFDPSINRSSHIRAPNHHFHDVGIWGDDVTTHEGWRMKTLSGVMKMLGHEKRTLDILKLDVEGSEWASLRSLIEDGLAPQIKQIIVEVHSPRLRETHTKLTKDDFANMFDVLMALQRVGFKRYLHHSDKYCCSGFMDLVPLSVAGKLLCCYELFLINENFMHNGV